MQTVTNANSKNCANPESSFAHQENFVEAANVVKDLMELLPIQINGSIMWIFTRITKSTKILGPSANKSARLKAPNPKNRLILFFQSFQSLTNIKMKMAGYILN